MLAETAALRPIFDRWPKLRARVPWQPLFEGPSPVVEHRGVWVKRDDLLGGGKVRKLEFFRRDGPLLALGAEGSNWLRALAERRPDARILTWPQAHNVHSRRNVPRIPGRRHRDYLQFGLSVLAELPRMLGGMAVAPIGGSDGVTTLGFVNAALELAGQVERGECPRPDAVFVALGTCGTAAGLALGLGLAGWAELPLHAVRITTPSWANARNVRGLAWQASHLLDESPRLASLEVETGFYGGYGVATPDALEAQRFFAPLDPDTSYAAKAAACLLAFRSRYRNPLLWLTSPADERATQVRQGRP